MIIDSKNYQDQRKKKYQVVIDVLKKHQLLNALRGSWKYNDFHLDTETNVSRSDLDLVVKNLSLDNRQKLKKKLQQDFANYLPLRVSIHSADSLLEMNLEDSFILNIGEFIAKTRLLEISSPDYDYTVAKILLLLLRETTDERYIDVVNRLNELEELHLALNIKLGFCTVFPVEKTILLSRYCEKSIITEFINECISQRPSKNYIETICFRVRQCESIDPWLQQYLIDKIHGVDI